MKIYNTLTKKIEELKPVKDGKIGIYSCGPTVYWNQHIGHMYAYVQWDILVRFLRYKGMDVKWVMNITDVGHMTSDADTGEDKMEKGAKREGVSVWDIADKYIAQFMDSLTLLNITTPDVMCRATKHINEQIELIKKMEARGFTYKTQNGIIFDTSKFPDYAKFAGLKLEKQAGNRADVVDDPNKKNPWDFFLWVTGNRNHVMKWDSPWGVGHPAWHIECTAMSTKYLGDRFDIHTGGIEHIGVHHTNEIAQGYGAFGGITANYWLHNAWLLDNNGEKISKSKGNFITAQELVEKRYDPLALRYLILNSTYRKGMKFSWEALDNASISLKKMKDLVLSLKQNNTREYLSSEKMDKIESYKNDFVSSLEDDLNIPGALAVVWNMLKSNIASSDKYDLAQSFDEVLGLNLTKEIIDIIPDEINALVLDREKYRKEGDYKKSDEIRDLILEKGYLIEDTPQGVKTKRATK